MQRARCYSGITKTGAQPDGRATFNRRKKEIEMPATRTFYLLIVICLVITACATQSPVETPPRTSAPSAAAPDVESEEWSEGPLPDGTWTVELSIEDFVSRGVSSSDAAGWEGVGTFIFQDGTVVYRHLGASSYECNGT